jgi:hypothetical protein
MKTAWSPVSFLAYSWIRLQIDRIACICNDNIFEEARGKRKTRTAAFYQRRRIDGGQCFEFDLPSFAGCRPVRADNVGTGSKGAQLRSLLAAERAAAMATYIILIQTFSS